MEAGFPLNLWKGFHGSKVDFDRGMEAGRAFSGENIPAGRSIFEDERLTKK